MEKHTKTHIDELIVSERLKRLGELERRIEFGILDSEAFRQELSYLREKTQPRFEAGNLVHFCGQLAVVDARALDGEYKYFLDIGKAHRNDRIESCYENELGSIGGLETDGVFIEPFSLTDEEAYHTLVACWIQKNGFPIGSLDELDMSKATQSQKDERELLLSLFNEL